MKRILTKKLTPVGLNRLIYVCTLITVTIYAWLSGERVLYVGLIVLLLLPVLSYIVTFIMLRGLNVKQSVPKSVQKNENGVYKVRLHSLTPMPFSHIECVFYCDTHAVEAAEVYYFSLNPFKPVIVEIPFKVRYRGQYELGLKMMRANDIAGLFQLKRVYNKNTTITAFPNVSNIDNYPMSMNLLTQAHSRFDIRDEDYATISDIRPYVPTDSIKRVHWKLTAKRNEWLVKIFQANALNQVEIILDSTQLNLPPQERYPLEDAMVEQSISLARFCLNKGMPVDFISTDGTETKTRNPQEFEAIYNAASRLKFEMSPGLNPLAILSHALNESAGYINAVIFTARIDKELSERILNAASNGHYISIIYFETSTPHQESEEAFQLLKDGNTPCFKVSP